MSSSQVDKAAEVLRNSYDTKTVCSPIRELIGDENINDAYRVQRINAVLREERGSRPVGAKIGLTSEVVQKQLGVDQPDYGVLFDDMRIPAGGTVAWNALMQPKGEVEIAFILSKDLASHDPTEEEVINAIDHGVVSIEIAGSRVKDWNIRITDTIADNASASHFILGSERISLNEIDLTGCAMEMKRNGQVVSSGTGSACLGSPLNAVRWLAKVLTEQGNPLRAGDIVLSGALGPMVDLRPGDHIEAYIEGMGTVDVHLGDEVSSLDTIVEQLDKAVLNAKAIPQISSFKVLTLDEAYEIQSRVIENCLGRGEKLVGLKMGFTAVAKMEQMGVHDMIWGRLTDRMAIENGGSMHFNQFIHPRVEPEIAFRISRNIDSEVPMESIRNVCDAIAPALEVIDSRYMNFKFSLEDVIADNCSSAGFAIGDWHGPDTELRALGMDLIINGKVLHTGSSDAILGDPWRSLQAATRLAARYGQTIPAGSIILAGAATAAEFLKAGDEVAVQVDKLGEAGFDVK